MVRKMGGEKKSDRWSNSFTKGFSLLVLRIIYKVV